MLWVIDIGNTNIVSGVHDGQTWLHLWRIQTQRDKMPDEYVVLFRALFQEAGLEPKQLTRAVISSVVPPLTGTLAEVTRRLCGFEPLIVGPHLDTGIRILLDNPAEIGSDLLANAVAGYHRMGGACIVVDFGTATTVIAVSERAEFLGGAIAPGLKLAVPALAGGTAQLPAIPLAAPPRAIGTGTISAIQSGIIYGYVGLVEGLVRRFRAEMGCEAPVIATGGLSGLMAQHTTLFNQVDVGLTLEGIRLIAERHNGAGA